MFMSRALPGVQGKPSPLLSSFRLSYYTLLNLMKRVEGGTHDLEYVIANSFQQFQQEQAMPKVCTGCTAPHCTALHFTAVQSNGCKLSADIKFTALRAGMGD
jgi:hypothetical protein